MNFSSNEVADAACERWGEPNKRLSSATELRFGTRGSLSVKIDANQFFDHELAEGGAVIAKAVPDIDIALLPRMIIKKYNYINQAGELHMQVRRFMPKDFRQARPDPNDKSKWIHSVKGLPVIPYRLPELLNSDYVIIVEGEKDADALAEAGFVASCGPGGANKFADELVPYFAGKEVFIIPDNDEAGIRHSDLISRKVFKHAKSVRVCNICSTLQKRADVFDWLQINSANELMAELRGFPAVTKPPVEELETVSNSDIFATIDADDMLPVTTSDDFVEGVLSKAQMSVVYGPSNCGKTFFMADLCLHIALGRSWRNKEVDAGGVIYVAAEGSYGIRNRVAAFKQHNELNDGIPFSVIPTSVNMLDAEADVTKLINTITHKSKEMGHVTIVVLDTLARVMAGGNENAAEDMGMLVINADKVRHATDAHVCFIHHSGKDESKGARGSSALRAATDTEIEIKKSGEISCATVTKQREMEIDGVFPFKLEVIEIGTNERGKTVTSCVVAEASVAEATPRKKKPRGANQKILFKGINNLAARGLLQDNRLGLPPTCKGLSLDALFEHLKGLIVTDSKHKRSRFNESVCSLVADEFLGMENEFVWLVEV